MCAASWTTAAKATCPESLRYELRPLTSATPVSLCDRYAGKVLLVVNTASRCGYTPQYEGLERLAQRYQARGMYVLGFPSNDFGKQEPGDEKQIAEFCRLNYGVNFPMFEKIRVSGATAHPFYRNLAAVSGTPPKWNFHKYLIGRTGQVVANFPSHVVPEDTALINAIEQQLAK
jgi:glutathione peroxidase